MFLGLDENKRGLKSILENKKILKLIHDCRNDWDSLLYQYSVRIYNFIDTQEAYFIFKLFYYQEITLPISLLKFIEMLTSVKLSYKEKFKNVMSEDPHMWSKRPLTEEQLAYASEDVVFLIKAWMNIRNNFNENLTEIIFFLTILKVVDIGMFNQFKEYLVANKAVQDQNISAIGYDFQKPLATNKTAAGRAQNRRVDVRIEPVSQAR